MMNKDEILCEKYNYKNVDELKKSQQLFMIKKSVNSTAEENKIRTLNYRSKNSYIVKCECGKSIKKYKFTDHKKSKFHIDFISNKNTNIIKYFK